jgi:hypothetical protein
VAILTCALFLLRGWESDAAPALAKLSAAPGAQRTAPGHATAALAAGLAAAGGAGISGGGFMAERSWVGPRPGFFFSTGDFGTGYYADPAQRVLASAHAAVAAAAAFAPFADASTLSSAGAAAAQFATAAVPARFDPASMAAAASARATSTGGGLTASMGAAGRVVQAKSDAGAPPPGWPYDAASGYYFDAAAQLYWDPASKLFFDCGKNEWRATQHAAGAAPPPKTRVVDKWGL